ncbi:MAG: ATP-binding cassette domain-containing protein [Bacteroidetes bacterium]|nr:ATP-binding cassette domain-containing protein [Bacteroidota bacterium]
MKIILENIGKRFNREWIFRNVSHEFSIGNKYAVLGTNGSGKSTLLQIIAGAMSQTEGKIEAHSHPLPLGGEKRQEVLPNGEVPIAIGIGGALDEFLFRHLSYAAPYLELPEEMTWKEAVHFHSKFKKFALVGISNPDQQIEKIISLSGLESAANKELRNFSSGMKQRARLALAILSDAPLLLLDEPSTNLDQNAVKWYQNLVSEFAQEKLVIVCSNYNKEEYSFCNKEFVLTKNQVNT